MTTNRRKTNLLNMPELRITARVKRVGNSLAIFIPAAEARRIGLHEDQAVDALLRTDVPHPLGLASDQRYEPFRRGDMWRDRI